VEVVSSALDRMTSGDLGARVTIGPRWSDDLVRIGGKLNQMAGAQEAQMKALKGVSSDIAHDLKTPLQRVAVYLEELEAKVDEDGEAAALVSRTQGEVNDMTRVFQSLLQLAQVEAGSPRNRFERVDLAQVCRTVVEVFEPSAVASNHHLSLTADLEEAFIKGDRALLGQMLSNLIENALRHTPDGSHVSVQLTAQDGQLKLIVADNGPGIPADEKDKVVQRLYRLDRSRHTPGHGLGLSLVEAVAGLHGATVELADNAPGLRVELSFPR
jgi:signal transduction histidine kinase